MDVLAVTKKLESAADWTSANGWGSGHNFSWMGNPLGEDVRTDGLDTYHGEFKRGLSDDDEHEYEHEFAKRGFGCGMVH